MLMYARRMFVALMCLSLNSCVLVATHVVGSAMRSGEVGDKFASWQAGTPPIPAGMGRVIVYPGGSRSFVYEETGIGRGGEQLLTVDRDVCTVLGHSFIFLDLPAGPHRVTAGDVSELAGYQIGINKLDLNVAVGTVTYVRIDKQVTGTFTQSRYFPTAVAPASAVAELTDFPIYKDGLQCRRNEAKDRKP